jgi:hypothetical protein
VTGVRGECGHHLTQLRRGVLDHRDQPRDAAVVTVPGLRDEISYRDGHGSTLVGIGDLSGHSAQTHAQRN